jgi:hypothetical protein
MKTVLDPVDYWRLRAKCSDAQRATAVAMQAREAMVTATKVQAAALTALGFDPNLPTFSLDDDTCTIDLPDGKGDV